MKLDTLIPAAELKRKESDYIEGGILHCGNCKQPKQYEVELFGRKRMVACMCKCAAEQFEADERRKTEEDRIRRIERCKLNGIQDKSYRGWTFEADDGSNPAQMDRARRYVEKWDSVYKENCGLLLWGDVGTGKTFFSACIANALTDRSVPVLMTNFSAIVSAMGFDDKDQYIKELRQYKLLVIDDLGTERQSEYMLEKVYNIIDSRYRDGQPIIITTNLELAEIKNPKNLSYKRIYDRVLEMCVPICFRGESRRMEVHQEKKTRLRAAFEQVEGRNEQQK